MSSCSYGCSNGYCDSAPSTGGAIIAGHNAADDFTIIPDCWISEAKEKFNVAYDHTSHGSQIISGLNLLESENSVLYAWADGSSSSLVLDIDDYFSSVGDLGSENSWAPATRTYLNSNPDVNVIMWSWCSILGHDINKYLNNMDDLIEDYPNVKFVFMTGHLAGSCDYNWDCSSRASYHSKNEQIRNHVESVEGILFDFGDIESYRDDSSTQCTSNSYLSDKSCSYPVECTWDGSTSCQSSCAHSRQINCHRKARAFWWMMARMAGWDGTSYDSCP